jgi:2-haloacid dehalogenase
MRVRVLVFDVIETLLDLQALDPAFEAVFGDRGARREWFQQMLQSAFVSTVTGAYRDFTLLGRGALAMTAERRGVQLSQDEQQRILGTLRQLPPHPDVIEGLSRVRDAGFRMAALSNSTAEVAEAQLQYAGLRGFFEQALSADLAKRLKPAREAYHMAADRLGVEPANVRLVATHAWDVTGAIRAGCAAAFVARPGMVLDPAGEQPDVVGRDLRDVTDEIIARERAEFGRAAAP